MITKDNLRLLLASLGYKKIKGNTKVWTRSFEASSSMITVDFEGKTIRYPKGLKINRATTTNFSQPENFVVLECITRLLSLGYTPQQLELEKSTPKGHGEGGGYCDIIIQDNEGKVFALVECKTMGSTKKGQDEFSRAWSRMEKDGGQLFNYFNTFRQAIVLCLYASDWVGERCVYQSRIVSIQDNESYIQAAKLRSYADVKEKMEGKEAYFKVWRDTYDLDYSSAGLFEEGTKPFTIGMRVLRAEDLKDADGLDIQKKYHEYATIMRQHNVSGRENAFDKLVNLFLAKIVDETRNSSALKFHWGGAATDDYYSLQDRLQKMYSEGMNEFLGEQVTYIDEQQISYAFTHYLGKLDATKDAVLQYFRQQKFYTNNDFAFLDVHNETLFRQNAEILKKVVHMLQDIRLRTENPNQFLGDLFEGFLDQGVKQNEGQFFTPLPIVRFIVSSLPLEKLHAERAVPKVIDYACGAGHFLNEYAQQVKPFISALGVAEQDCYNKIYGIEKEYRLSKVAKVSAFMYGQEGINIIYQDALKKHECIKEGEFSVLIANPPYSVKGFLETLTEEERLQYELNTDVSDISVNNSIEVFFLERASQLLRSGGVAGIILPSSILSNGNIYSRARELMLREFQIVAIAELGSGTFGKTETNTVTLFLKKRDMTVPAKKHYRKRVEAWFSGDFAADSCYQDASLLEGYCRMQGIDLAEYKTLLRGAPSKALWEHRLFKSYQGKFTAAKGVKDIPTAVRKIEQEKLYYYLLAKSNEQPILIIKSPADKASNKRFLGYQWSSRKGCEGIKYHGSATKPEDEDELSLIKGIDSIQTPLFNPRDLGDASRINSLVRSCFLGEAVSIPEELRSYCSTLRLTDMLDFKRADWDAAIRTTVKNEEQLSGYNKYQLKNLEHLLLPVKSNSVKVPQDHIIEAGMYPVITQEREHVIAGYTNRDNPILDLPIIVFGDHSCSLKYIDYPFFRGADGTQLIKVDETVISAKCLYYYLQSVIQLLPNREKYERHFKYLKRLSVPLPPMEIQQAIVDECAVVDAEYESLRISIEEYRERISSVFKELEIVKEGRRGGVILVVKELAHIHNEKILLSAVPIGSYISTDNMLQDKAGVVAYDGIPTIDKVTSYKVNDILISNIRPYLKKIWKADKDGGCSNDVIVLRLDDDRVHAQYLYYCLSQDAFFDYMMLGAKGVKMPRGDKKQMMNYSIPVPPLSEQERIIREIEGYEAEIRKAEAVMQGAEVRKSAILQKYLE